MTRRRARAWRARWRRVADPASLGAKLVLILSGVGLAGAAGITLFLAGIITPGFDRLEAKAAQFRVERGERVLADIAERAARAARDEADRASRTSPRRPDRIDRAPDVDAVARLAPDGRVIGVTTADPRLRATLVAQLAQWFPAGVVGEAVPSGGYVWRGARLLAIGVAAIPAPDSAAVAQSGWIVTARDVTAARLSADLRFGVMLVAAGVGSDRPMTAAWRTIMVAGHDGRPVAGVRFEVPRDVSQLGRRVLLLAVAGSTLLLLLILIVVRRIVGRLVLRPLARVEAHMQRISASNSLALLDEDHRRDEIGSLGRSLNAMLRQLHALSEQIEMQSFRLGRTESAVAVMHNVRNALNPISTVLSQERAHVPAVDDDLLARAFGELTQDDLPPARRRKMAAFVAAAFEAEATARAATRHDLSVGRDALAHVLEIIGQQQKQAHERPALEEVDVTEIVARNAAIARYCDTASIAFAFPAGRHAAMANRVILSQVIGNLIGNAAEAIAATGQGSGTIAVTAEHRGGSVIVRIRDDGEGFDPASGAVLFQRGFSTRSHKSGGLGLHWCANSIATMDGSLRLESEGPGLGAVAVLTLEAPPACRAAA